MSKPTFTPRCQAALYRAARGASPDELRGEMVLRYLADPELDVEGELEAALPADPMRADPTLLAAMEWLGKEPVDALTFATALTAHSSDCAKWLADHASALPTLRRDSPDVTDSGASWILVTAYANKTMHLQQFPNARTADAAREALMTGQMPPRELVPYLSGLGPAGGGVFAAATFRVRAVANSESRNRTRPRN